jgi:hypothetical protein
MLYHREVRKTNTHLSITEIMRMFVTLLFRHCSATIIVVVDDNDAASIAYASNTYRNQSIVKFM